MPLRVSGAFGALVVLALLGAASAACSQGMNLNQCADYCLKDYNGRLVFDCCDRVEKSGACPARDVATYSHALDLSALHCCSDLDCPGAYKCCKEARYDQPFSLCKRPVYRAEAGPTTAEGSGYDGVGSGASFDEDEIETFSGSGDGIFRDDVDRIKEYSNDYEPTIGSGDKEYTYVNANRIEDDVDLKEKNDMFFDDEM